MHPDSGQPGARGGRSRRRQARLLDVAPGTALLRVTSIFTDREGMPLELRRALYRGDYYKFNVVRDLS